jgi:hypothetical protein
MHHQQLKQQHLSTSIQSSTRKHSHQFNNETPTYIKTRTQCSTHSYYNNINIDTAYQAWTEIPPIIIDIPESVLFSAAAKIFGIYQQKTT